MKRSFAIASLMFAGLGCGKQAPPAQVTQPVVAASEVAVHVEEVAAPADVAAAVEVAAEVAPADVAAAPADIVAAPADVAAAPAPSPADVVFAIDAGPKAGKLVEVGELAQAKGDAKVLKALCAAEQKAHECEGGQCQCAVRELPNVAARAIKGAAIIDVSVADIPSQNQRIALAIDGPDGWKQVAYLGNGEVGLMGTRTYDHADVLGYGSYDFGALGGWMWVDVMQLRSSLQTGSNWDRTLWLCGGVGAVTCHALPIKFWYSPMLGDEMTEAPAKSPRTMFALSATLTRDGTLTLVSKVDQPSDEITNKIGSFRLDALK